jgi:hypothetical protein
MVMFSGVVLVHAVMGRIPRPGNSVFRFLAIGAAAGLALAVGLVRGHVTAVETVAALLVYALSCELYLFTFTMTIGSISAHLLITLSHGEKTLAELELSCASRAMVEKRIARLVSAGLLVPVDTRFAVTGRGGRLAGFFRAFRVFFRHPSPPSG